MYIKFITIIDDLLTIKFVDEIEYNFNNLNLIFNVVKKIINYRNKFKYVEFKNEKIIIKLYKKNHFLIIKQKYLICHTYEFIYEQLINDTINFKNDDFSSGIHFTHHKLLPDNKNLYKIRNFSHAVSNTYKKRKLNNTFINTKLINDNDGRVITYNYDEELSFIFKKEDSYLCYENLVISENFYFKYNKIHDLDIFQMFSEIFIFNVNELESVKNIKIKLIGNNNIIFENNFNENNFNLFDYILSLSKYTNITIKGKISQNDLNSNIIHLSYDIFEDIKLNAFLSFLYPDISKNIIIGINKMEIYEIIYTKNIFFFIKILSRFNTNNYISEYIRKMLKSNNVFKLSYYKRSEEDVKEIVDCFNKYCKPCMQISKCIGFYN